MADTTTVTSLTLDTTAMEGETLFNFDHWITENGLNDIRHVFIKHDMITTEALSMHSESFKKFICDPQLMTNHSHLMPIAISAMQNLATYVPPTPSSLDSFVVISEEENAVMESIKCNISKLSQIETELHELKVQYPESIEKRRNEELKQIENAQNKVMHTFDKISHALSIKKQIILKKLDNVKHDVTSEDKDKDQVQCKELNVLTSSLQTIDTSRALLTQKLDECTNKITATTDNQTKTIKNRKDAIVSIGKETKKRFDKTEKELKKNTESAKRMIDHIDVNIDFVVNQKAYDKILNKINHIGVVRNASRMEDELCAIFEDEGADEMRIQIVKQETESKQEEIDKMQSIITNKTSNNDEEEKEKTTIETEILRFSDEFITKLYTPFELSDDGRCIKRTSNGYVAYVLSDMDPVTSGVHCWRVKITNPKSNNHWIIFAVSQRDTFDDDSYLGGDVFGVSCCSQYYGNNIKNNGVNTKHLHGAKYVDLLLDVDNGKLSICEVGTNYGDEKEAKLWNLPTDSNVWVHGWVPHFNITYIAAGIELRLAKIDTSLYGKAKA
eukprot:230678_1